MAEIPPTNPKNSPIPGGTETAMEPMEPSLIEELQAFGKWCAENTGAALLLAGIVATLVYFFGVIQPFVNGSQSAAMWAWRGWNEENELTHGWMVPLVTIGLIWFHRMELRRAAKGGSILGMVWVIAGLLLFVLSVRCLQPRMALASVPFLLFGATAFVWGKSPARIILFPCAFLVFMIPVAQLQQATFKLQFIITGMVGLLSRLVGIGIQAVGTTLTATNGSFNFEIAEGCSGIRSLTAMAMITAIFVHLTQDRLWKKATIFFSSVLFALIGNVCRIFTVVLVARFYDAKFAGGLYHDWSGFISIIFAMMAMMAFSKLVNLDFERVATQIETKAKAVGKTQPKDPVNYDY